MYLGPDLYPATPGLIIDAFGELRDQQEQVKEDMEVRLCPRVNLRNYGMHREKLIGDIIGPKLRACQED